MDAASRSWRARSLAAVAPIVAEHPEEQRAALTSATEALLDRIAAARRDARAGKLSPSQLRSEIAAARREATDALRLAAEGDDEVVSAIWAALQEASSPL